MSEEIKELDEDLKALSEASDNADALQEAMIEKAEENSEDTLGMAANVHYTLQPRYFSMLNTLSRKQLLRLNKALATYPLNENEFNHQGVEKEAFLIGNRMLEAKYTLIFHTYFEEFFNNQEKVNNKEQQVKETEDGKA